MASSTRAEKKQLGAFYTPSQATEILAQWAIRNPFDQILEPSFGTCGFLEASIDRLKQLGNREPEKQLYGCDIDERAFSGPYRSIFGKNGAASRFLNKDFLEVCSSEFSTRFEAVIGNPPYVSYHNMSDRQRGAAEKVIRKGHFSLDRKASLWAYFVLHSLDFLNEGGRTAWILPVSFLHSEYASTVRSAIATGFERSLALSLGQRLFLSEGTEESSVILLADRWQGRRSEESNLNVSHVSDLGKLNKTISRWENGEAVGETYDSKVGTALMRPKALSAIDRVESCCRVIRFGEIADVKIGIVTGANRFFVLSQEKAAENDLKEDDLKYIFAKFRIAQGLRVNGSDLEQARVKNIRCLFLNTENISEASKSLKSYLDSFPEEKRLSNATFKKRSDWRQPDDGRTPDAFFPYMQQAGPRLVLNNAGVNSTNTVHRVYFRSKISEVESKAVAISMLSTFSQLSAELEGRTYGSGVLKQEPSEVRSIRLVLPDDLNTRETEQTFQTIDERLRDDDSEEAERIANRFVMEGKDQLSVDDTVLTLSDALRRARERRKVKRG